MLVDEGEDVDEFNGEDCEVLDVDVSELVGANVAVDVVATTL